MLAAPKASAFDRLACLKRGRGICFLTYFCTKPMRRRDGIGNRLAAWVKITCGTGTCSIAAASLPANMSIATIAATICSRDVDDNSCSHNERLDCFGRFGNRPNESDHYIRPMSSPDMGTDAGGSRR